MNVKKPRVIYPCIKKNDLKQHSNSNYLFIY